MPYTGADLVECKYLVGKGSDRGGWAEEVLYVPKDNVSRETVSWEPILLNLGHLH